MSNSYRISMQQETFVNEILKGKTYTEAYKIAYPASRNWKTGVSESASKLANTPKIKMLLDKGLEEFREREKLKTGWTREEAITQLKFVVETNRKDLERIQLAAEEELQFLAEQIEKNPEMATTLVLTMLEKRKTTRANSVNNTGIISAVSELNKLQGYNEQTINMNGTVVFSEEELED